MSILGNIPMLPGKLSKGKYTYFEPILQLARERSTRLSWFFHRCDQNLKFTLFLFSEDFPTVRCQLLSLPDYHAIHPNSLLLQGGTCYCCNIGLLLTADSPDIVSDGEEASTGTCKLTIWSSGTWADITKGGGDLLQGQFFISISTTKAHKIIWTLQT